MQPAPASTDSASTAEASTEARLLYRETFEEGPGAWSTGKNQEDGTWHRNIFGCRGEATPLSWKADGGRAGGCAYTEPPWYFDDNHGEFAWLYLLFFVNRSALLGLDGHDLRGVTIRLALRGEQCDLKGTKLYFWIQGRDGQGLDATGTPSKPLYNWALTSSPIDDALLDNQWHDANITLMDDESQWSHMGHINGGLAHRIKVLHGLDSADGTLGHILNGGHVNLGFLLCGVDPNDPPTGRIEIDQISIWTGARLP